MQFSTQPSNSGGDEADSDEGGAGGLRQVLPADSNPIWEAQRPLLRGEQAVDIDLTWMPSSMTQPY